MQPITEGVVLDKNIVNPEDVPSNVLNRNVVASSVAASNMSADGVVVFRSMGPLPLVASNLLSPRTPSVAGSKSARSTSTEYRMRLEVMKARALNQPIPGEFGSTGLTYMTDRSIPRVGTARYQPSRCGSPSVSPTGTFLPLKLAASSPRVEAVARRARIREFKTERFREKGVVRWPNEANAEMDKHPMQFAKHEEMMPLYRGTLDTPRSQMSHEIWSRSLRTGEQGISMDSLGGMRNPDLTSAAQRMLFDSQGVGFTGRTNSTHKIIPLSVVMQ